MIDREGRGQGQDKGGKEESQGESDSVAMWVRHRESALHQSGAVHASCEGHRGRMAMWGWGQCDSKREKCGGDATILSVHVFYSRSPIPP